MSLWVGLVLCQAAAAPVVAPAASPSPSDDAAIAARDEYVRQRSRLYFELNSWGDASLIGSGLAFLAARGPFARGFELQTAVWGLGAAAVAVYRLLDIKHHPVSPGTVEGWAGLRRDARRDHHIDAGIDLVLLAIALTCWRSLRAARWRGMAAGIALQCGFLAAFNLLASLAFRT